jgi:hypothetical protein
LSDVHANPIALDAVLRDIEERGGADEYWVLGDVVAMGFDPAAVLRRLTALPNARFVRGNTDRYVLTGQGATARGPLSVADAQANPDVVPSLVGIARISPFLTAPSTGSGAAHPCCTCRAPTCRASHVPFAAF